VVGEALMAVAALLEALQAFTPDQSAHLPAIFYSAGGALASALLAELFIQAWRWHVLLGAPFSVRCISTGSFAKLTCNPSRLIMGDWPLVSDMQRWARRSDIVPDIVALVIWLIAGIVGGFAVGDLFKRIFDLERIPVT
jgi:hypothetical protein